MDKRLRGLARELVPPVVRRLVVSVFSAVLVLLATTVSLLQLARWYGEEEVFRFLGAATIALVVISVVYFGVQLTRLLLAKDRERQHLLHLVRRARHEHSKLFDIAIAAFVKLADTPDAGRRDEVFKDAVARAVQCHNRLAEDLRELSDVEEESAPDSETRHVSDES